jgi:hypothetical protein
MGYKSSPFKMAPKSPMLKALKGNQGKLPQQLQDAIKAAPESPAKQTTANEFAYEKSLKDKKMGKSTKVVDKVKAAYDAMTTDKTYADAKKGYRKAAKKAYDAKSPAKVKDPVTGSKVKGYAKSDFKVDKVRDKQERKDTKAEKLATAKSDGKVTRLERKGIKDSQAKLKNEQVAKRNNKFQDQKVADKTHKERTKLRAKSKNLSDAVAVGLDKKTAQKKMDKADAKADKRVAIASKRAERKKF